MSLIPKEQTLVEICQRLNVTPSCISKVKKELGLHQKGKGKLRLFTREEFWLFRNVKIMRTCNISWSIIKEIYEKEQKIRKDIALYVKKLKKINKNKKASLVKGKAFLEFILEKPLEIPFNIYANYQKQKGTTTIYNELSLYLEESGLTWVKQEVDMEVEKTKKELEQFTKMMFYKPIEAE
jgi:hypothetical protein